ncbi:hypothetical protein SELMODRAFT_267604 [Selaginella moellendorffii]|uniref:Probable magnesium transporter n=1 Tax=Selaginella moellendorffii TaxID=88036 RepID=D8RQK2_SELML|nr:probable magnesium transporter NIPA4 isoform X1 [Selaginella moellendorffii]EFJ25462.1 hypothetical protein SELMODRAFT_267604 [Selaginella moellendorffii]|eukprot:XP_002973088.1 probable magnesium transporter NIPA4 isoform X1 [Selaginella moellendorffii]
MAGLEFGNVVEEPVRRETNHVGLILALSSSVFIGSSFIMKKKGLKKAGASGVRAGVGGYSYLLEPLWWSGMITMIVGEIANFAAYAFAPAVLVTPLGALSIIVSAILADIMLKEKLAGLGILGCLLCVVGSVGIVLNAPEERIMNSVDEVWRLATEPAFLLYALAVVSVVLVLTFHFVPRIGQTQVMVYVGICSLMGSLSVMSAKALGIAIKLTFQGSNQLIYSQTWVFGMVLVTCVVTQMNYLNKALDTFNTAVVSPIYYVMFTTFTIVASVIMFKVRSSLDVFLYHKLLFLFQDWDTQSPRNIVSEISGFITILSGTYLLHVTKDYGKDNSMGVYTNLPSHIYSSPTSSKQDVEAPGEEMPMRRQ